MRKTLALFLTVALMLSLAACGGGSSSMTKEEMLEIATECDFATILSAFSNNKVNAEETYCGKVYLFTGYVGSIEETSVRIIPFNTPLTFDGYNQVALDVSLSTDEMKELSTDEVINIVGEITSFGDEGHTIYIENAYYVDNLITFTAEVDGFASNAGFKQTTFISDMEIIGDYPVTFSYEYMGEYVDLSQPGAFDSFEQETLQDVTVLEGDTVTITGKLTYNTTTYLDLGGGLKSFTREFALTEVNSIEKN